MTSSLYPPTIKLIYRDPTRHGSVNWKSFNQRKQNMLYITNDGVSIESKNSVLAEDANYRLKFWTDLFNHYKMYAKF